MELKNNERYKLTEKLNDALNRKEKAEMDILNLYFDLKTRVELNKIVDKMENEKQRKPLSWWVLLIGNIAQAILTAISVK